MRLLLAALLLLVGACDAQDTDTPAPDPRTELEQYDEQGRLVDAAMPFAWSVEHDDPSGGTPPSRALGDLDVRTLRRVVATERPWNAPGRTLEKGLVAAYDDPAAADAAAERLRRRLPRGLLHQAADHAVVRIGPLVVVRAVRGDVPVRRVHALVAGATTVRELDPSRERFPVFDLSCRARDDAQMQEFASDLIDYENLGHLQLRSPWVGHLTAGERLARRTAAAVGSIQRALLSEDAGVGELGSRYAEALERGDRDEAQRLVDAIGARVAKLTPSSLEGEFDAEVFALLTPADAATQEERLRQVAQRAGALPRRSVGESYVPTGPRTLQTAFVTTTRLGERLEIAGVMPVAPAAGLASLLLRLTELGCDDVRVGLFGWERVRQD